MRKNVKVSEAIFPMPVLMIATYNDDGSVNVMNAAWGTMQARDHVVLNLTRTHKTVKNIEKRKAFTVSLVLQKLIILDWYQEIILKINLKTADFLQ